MSKPGPPLPESLARAIDDAIDHAFIRVGAVVVVFNSVLIAWMLLR